jgi:hypothetical protein
MSQSLSKDGTFVEAAASQTVVAEFGRQDPCAVQGLRSQFVRRTTDRKRGGKSFETFGKVPAVVPEPAAADSQAKEYFSAMRGQRENECRPNVAVFLLEESK